MNLILFALRRPITVMVAMVAVAASRPGRAPDARRHLPQPEPAGDLRRPALRRHGPGADGRASDQLLRIPLPLHQRHPPRRVAEHPGHGPDEALLSSRHQHGPGDGRDDQLRQPRPGLHAAGHRVAVRDALRHRQRAGRLPGAVQRDPEHRRDPGPGPVPRAADVRQPAGRLGAAAVRRQPAHRSSSTSIPTGCGPTTCRPTTWSRPWRQGNTISPSGNVRLDDKYPIVPVNSMVRDVRGTGDHPACGPARRRRSTSATWLRGRRHRHPHRLRPGQRPPGRLHPGDQAGRRLDAERGQRRQGGPARDAGRPARDIHVSFEFDQSPYVTRAIGAWPPKGRSAPC